VVKVSVKHGRGQGKWSERPASDPPLAHALGGSPVKMTGPFTGMFSVPTTSMLRKKIDRTEWRNTRAP